MLPISSCSLWDSDVWPDVPIKMGFIRNKLAQRLLYRFEKSVYRNASWLVPLSTGMNENIQHRFPNIKYTIIPNISELKRFAEPIEPGELPTGVEEKKIVLYAGTLGNVNGLKYVVDLASFTQGIDESIGFLIYGDGKEKEEILKYATKKGVLNRTFFYGGVVSKSQLPYLYSVSTMGSSFVIDNPVLWDNSANKFFDTLAASKPILINHRGWQAEAIEEANIGYVLPVVLSKKVAWDFVQYINNKPTLRLQSKNAFALAQKEYSLEVAIERYLTIFKKVSESAHTLS